MGLQSDVSQAMVVGQSGHRPIRREKGWTWLNTVRWPSGLGRVQSRFCSENGEGGQRRNGDDIEEHVTYQDNRLSCKAQRLREAKDNRFEDFVECDCDSRKGSLVQGITCGT